MCVRASVLFTCRHFHSAFAPLFCFFFCLQRLVQSHNRPCAICHNPHHTHIRSEMMREHSAHSHARKVAVVRGTRRLALLPEEGAYLPPNPASVLPAIVMKCFFLRVETKTYLSDRVFGLPRFSCRHFRRLLPSLWWPLYSRQGTSWNQLAQVYRSCHRTFHPLLCL